MTMLRIRRVVVGFALMVSGVLLSVPAFADQQPQSTNYRFDESSIGTGGLFDSSSTNYQSTVGAGDLSVGSASSTNFQTEAGSRTTHDPVLKFAVTDPSANFTDFSPSITSTATTTFEVTNYTSWGYAVQLIGDSPTNGSHVIHGLTSAQASIPGTEQFGVNVVANTSPISFGANPDNGTSPNNFGHGEAATNYDIPNEFRFVSGETIAQAPKSSGKTIYTVSYIINVEALKTKEKNNGKQTPVVTGTY